MHAILISLCPFANEILLLNTEPIDILKTLLLTTYYCQIRNQGSLNIYPYIEMIRSGVDVSRCFKYHTQFKNKSIQEIHLTLMLSIPFTLLIPRSNIGSHEDLTQYLLILNIVVKERAICCKLPLHVAKRLNRQT